MRDFVVIHRNCRAQISRSKSRTITLVFFHCACLRDNRALSLIVSGVLMALIGQFCVSNVIFQPFRSRTIKSQASKPLGCSHLQILVLPRLSPSPKQDIFRHGPLAKTKWVLSPFTEFHFLALVYIFLQYICLTSSMWCAGFRFPCGHFRTTFGPFRILDFLTSLSTSKMDSKTDT